MRKGFSVHKYIVMNNRQGFYLWAVANNKKELFDQIAKELIPLDSFPEGRVPLEIVSNEIRRTIDLTNEPNLGLKVIASTDLQISPFYKLLEMALAPAFNRSVDIPFNFFLRLVSSYYQILTEVVTVELKESKTEVRLIFKPNLPELVTYHQIEGAMYGVSRLIAKFTNCWPNKVEFIHVPAKIDLDTYIGTFKSAPTFNDNQNQLVYLFSVRPTQTEYPCLINPLNHSINKNFPEISYKERIIILLSSTLGFIQPSRQNIADLMSMSVKTLQRRLSEEGETFNQILYEIRKEKVNQYLISQQFSLEQVGLLLGYKAKSQFLKAFHIWFGMTPNEYKARVLHLA